MKKPKRFEGDEEAFTATVEFVTLTSYHSYGDVLRKAADYMDTKAPAGQVFNVKASRSAEGFQLKIQIMREGE